MKTINLTSGVLIAFLLLPFFAAGQIQQEVRETAPFTGINTSGAISVVVTEGDTFNVVVETEANQLQQIETTVHRDILEIRFTGRNSKGDISAYVTAPVFTSLSVSGASSIKSENTLVSPALSLSGSGASTLNLMVETDLLTTVLSGASNMTIVGSAIKHELNVSGAGLVRGYDLDTEVSNIVASGASNVRVSATSAIDIDASGTSKVSYRGEPLDKKVKVIGVSKVQAVNTTGSTTTTEADTVVVRIGQREVVVTERDQSKTQVKVKKRRYPSFRDNWTGIDLGINGYVGSDNSTDLKGDAALLDLDYAKSVGVNLNLWQQNLILVRGHLGFVTGLGVGWNNFRFADKQVTLEKGPQSLIIHHDSPYEYKKNKLTVTYVNVPLLLEFQTNPNMSPNKFHLAAGINVGMRVSSHTKQMLFIDKNREKFKDHKDFYINPFRYDATARIGWGRINLFASYALNTLFRDGKGPELTPFTAGISLLSF